MKIFVILVAGAHAFTCADRDPCDLRDWVENNWLTSAAESFNFIANNREQFGYAVGYSEYDFEAVLQPLCNHLDRNGDSEVSTEEFTKLSVDDLVDAEQYDEFAAKYWHIFDFDKSGSLNFDECMYTLVGVAHAYARLFFKFFDENGNGVLDGREFVKLEEEPSFKWDENQRRAYNHFGITPIFRVAYESLIYKGSGTFTCPCEYGDWISNNWWGSTVESLDKALSDKGSQTFACPCDYDDWVENNWWASAVESFDFALHNREHFTNAVKSIDEISPFHHFFNWFDPNGDSEVSTEEFAKTLVGELVDAEQYDEFAAKYWHIFDSDSSGTLNFDEWMYSFAVIVDAFARLFIKGFDENSNGILDGQEMIKFKEEPMFDQDDQRSAWIDSKMGSDNNTITKNELAQFLLIMFPNH